MRHVLLIACLMLAACGPAEPEKDPQAREFMKDFGKCPECGKRPIKLFEGYEK